MKTNPETSDNNPASFPADFGRMDQDSWTKVEADIKAVIAGKKRLADLSPFGRKILAEISTKKEHSK